MIKMLFLLTALISGLLIFLWTKSYYTGPKSDHFDGHRFHNHSSHDRNFSEALKWMMTRHRTPWPEHVDYEKFPKPQDRVGKNELRVTFVNHATVLVQWDGLNILTDPVWSERVSPFSWIGPKRVYEPGIAWDDLPKIDVVLLSHNHYDHMDKDTLKILVARDHPTILTGLGNGTILRGFGIPESTELDWWQSTEIQPDWKITYVPAEHFSARWPWDRDKALWGGFVVQNPHGAIYFAGDTGMGAHIQKIADAFASFRLALLPIGAYEPRWFMKPAHISPEEAVAIHQTLKANKSLAIHFGTFQLSDEGIDDPAKDLDKALKASNLSKNDFWLLKPGESRSVP